MFEAGIREGIVQSVHRYAKANSKYMKSYNPSLPLTYIVYLDLNNLYGWAMCQSLPIGGFRWIINDQDSWNAIKFMISLGMDEKDICWKLMLIAHVILMIYTMNCHSYLKSWMENLPRILTINTTT